MQRAFCGQFWSFLLLCSLIALFFGTSVPLPAQASGLQGKAWGDEAPLDTHAEQTPRDVFITLAGGVSLGNYEAGYVAEALRFFRQNRDRYRVRGLSGTSAGGINALAGALEYCRVQTDDPAQSSVNYDAWMPISWQMLYDEDKVTSSSVFHHDGLRAHGAKLLRPGAYVLREDCDLWVQVAVTQDLSLRSLSDPHKSIDMIEHIGVRVTADENGHVVYRQLPPRADTSPRRVALPADAQGIVAPKAALDMITATAAFPVAFPSVKMTVQEGSAAHPRRGVLDAEKQYYDGGVFENVPVRPILPFVETENGSEPLVLVVDLSNSRIPPVVDTREIGGDLAKFASSWLKFARARDYSSSVVALENADVEIWRALQRYPVAGEFLSAFAGFFDHQFRQTDYALGVHDALADLEGWAPDASQHTVQASDPSVNACVHHMLSGGQYEDCATPPSRSVLATLRGVAAAAESRCSTEDITSMGCAMFREEELADRLPTGRVDAGREARLRRAAGKAPSDDFQAFLEELRLGDFQPELNGNWMNLRGAKKRRPEILWSRLIEDALRRYAKKQPRPVISSEVAFEAFLSSALPVLPRTSASALINLSSLEATMSIPLSPRFSADLGVTAEWASKREREKPWHLFSAGPVARFGWMLSKRHALVSSIADVHAGVLFGPVLPSVAAGDNGPGVARGRTRPNAAAFVGIAPRFILLRRLQVDIPIRAYWQCDTPMCTSFSSARPGYSISFRLGWNWTMSPRIRGATSRE